MTIEDNTPHGGGGSASDVSVVDSSSLGFNNVQEFADYIIAKMNDKANATDLSGYVKHFGYDTDNHRYSLGNIAINGGLLIAGGSGAAEGGEFNMIKPPGDDGNGYGGWNGASDLIIDICTSHFRIYNHNYNNSNTAKIFLLNFDEARNGYNYIHHDNISERTRITASAPSVTNTLWAY